MWYLASTIGHGRKERSHADVRPSLGPMRITRGGSTPVVVHVRPSRRTPEAPPTVSNPPVPARARAGNPSSCVAQPTRSPDSWGILRLVATGGTQTGLGARSNRPTISWRVLRAPGLAMEHSDPGSPRAFRE